jgi:(R,R)-butanediol dehydrogenase/meso-butanediol dehydrogenase/diacetyl reductase
MNAAFLKIKNMQFEIRDVKIPMITCAESLVHVQACGICGTDLNEYKKKFETWKSWKRLGLAVARRAGLNLFGRRELRLGHEICGIVEDTSRTDLENKKVVVFPDIPCGTCWACQHGIETACIHFNNIGFERAGGFAEYVAVPNGNLFLISETLDSSVAVLAEPLACGLHAIETARMKNKSNVLVLGTGPIGLLITYICSTEFGSSTVACDFSSFRLKIAREMGATVSIKPNELKSQNLFPDVVFDCTGGLSPSIDAIMDIVRPRATICIEGFHEGIQHIRLRRLQRKEAQIVTSQGNSVRNRQDAILRIERYEKELQPLITHIYPLEKISEAFLAAIRNDKNKAVKIIVKP